jgi:hypothetical protein
LIVNLIYLRGLRRELVATITSDKTIGPYIEGAIFLNSLRTLRYPSTHLIFQLIIDGYLLIRILHATGLSVIGARVGTGVGADVTGASVGSDVGADVIGAWEGSRVGGEVTGAIVGSNVGAEVACAIVGSGVGAEVVGACIGSGDGAKVTGASVGSGVGFCVGTVDGICVGSSVPDSTSDGAPVGVVKTGGSVGADEGTDVILASTKLASTKLFSPDLRASVGRIVAHKGALSVAGSVTHVVGVTRILKAGR